MNIPIETARIAHPHPTPRYTGMEPRSGGVERKRCHEFVVHSREGSRSSIEEGETACGAYKRVSVM